MLLDPPYTTSPTRLIVSCECARCVKHSILIITCVDVRPVTKNSTPFLSAKMSYPTRRQRHTRAVLAALRTAPASLASWFRPSFISFISLARAALAAVIAVNDDLRGSVLEGGCTVLSGFSVGGPDTRRWGSTALPLCSGEKAMRGLSPDRRAVPVRGPDGAAVTEDSVVDVARLTRLPLSPKTPLPLPLPLPLSLAFPTALAPPPLVFLARSRSNTARSRTSLLSGVRGTLRGLRFPATWTCDAPCFDPEGVRRTNLWGDRGEGEEGLCFCGVLLFSHDMTGLRGRARAVGGCGDEGPASTGIGEVLAAGTGVAASTAAAMAASLSASNTALAESRATRSSVRRMVAVRKASRSLSRTRF